MTEKINNTSEINFDDVYQELDQINSWFRDVKKFNLNEGLIKHKRSMALLRLVKGRLQEVEKEFEEINNEYKKDFSLDKNDNKIDTKKIMTV